MSISPPVKITTPFATSGIKAAIPATSDPVDGRAGYDEGFPAINFQPKVAGGIPPWGEDFNGIFFEVTQALQFLEAGGSFPYDGTWATAVGGYPVGALVSRSDNSGLWRNTVANNTTDPESGGTGWQPEDAGATSITMTNANVTLTPLQAARPVIIITGTLTANVQLIFPAYARQWSVVNNTTGSFTVTCKTASGSGAVARAGATQITGDGTNINSTGYGSLIGVQRFDTVGAFTYTASQGTKFVIAEGVGGGGAGGGAPATAVTTVSVGTGGTSGAYAKGLFTSGFDGVTVTVGAAGVPVAGAGGGAGGTTSFGSLLTIPGGPGGAAQGPSSPGFGPFGGAASGTPTGGDIESTGGSVGSPSFTTTGPVIVAGVGGHSRMGAGGTLNTVGANGGPANGRGGGGAGAFSGNSTAARSGGAGGAGLLIVWEFG